MPGIIRGFHPIKGAIDLAADMIGECLIAQGPEHQMTHEGKHFLLAHHFGAVATSGYARIRFTTPAAGKYIHAVFFSHSSGGLLRAVYRTPGFTHNASNVLTGINRNENYKDTILDPLTEACHTPSGSGSGTVFIPIFPFGSGGFFTAGPGSNRDENEFDLLPATTYLLEAQSLVDDNYITLGVDYYYRDEV